MKKIFLSLVAVMATMNINAQVVKVYENGTLSDTYTDTSTKKYKVVFEEVRTTDKAAVSESAGITGNEVQWVQLWADGPKWAVFNVGATKVTGYGGYYNWGKSVNMATDGSYSESTTDIQGTSDDTAKNIWGDNWQMPTKADFDDLVANCNVTWVKQNGVKGKLYTGKGDYSSNSVFFPAAGWYENGSRTYDDWGGKYWASTPYDSSLAVYLIFGESYQDVGSAVRYCGCSVRAILKE